MQKTMRAKYHGKCAVSGARINPGDDIVYDTVSRKAWINEPGDCRVSTIPDNGRYISESYRHPRFYIPKRT